MARAENKALDRILGAKQNGQRQLNLRKLGLTRLPPETFQLKDLLRLWLDRNNLTELPSELWQLTDLLLLNLSDNLLGSIPREIEALSRLQSLSIERNKISALPSELFHLKELVHLSLSLNRLTYLPKEIGQLTKLEELLLYSNDLESVPKEIEDLTNLRILGLSANRLTVFPPEFASLQKLTQLRLSANNIRELPPEIGRLTQLRQLRLSGSELRTLPPELGNLQQLERLDLQHNRLSALPVEIGQLAQLRRFDLRENPIAILPVELGRCQQLTDFYPPGSSGLRFPPRDIAELGSNAIIRYLRAADIGVDTVWDSKLLLVGEGAVGKTWLYEALNGRIGGGNRRTDGATIGIEIGTLELPHPDLGGVSMRLNCWDFAGQDINHATHQFFFSERTLFLLCWNARAGWEAGKLRSWLTNIRDRAPGALVLLVATHSDQPHSDYPEKELRDEFDQIVGTFKVSNETGDGIKALKDEIGRQAKDLPMMGLRWPKTWRAGQQAVRGLRELAPYASLKQVRGVIHECGLEDQDATVLLRWLHELGEVLHYAEIPDLVDLVMLDPQWVTQRVGEVLANSDVQSAKGVLTRERLEQIWPNLEGHVRQHLLGMMDRFDLAYQIPEDRDHRCLVVERLPQNPPDYEAVWAATAGQPEIRLRYRLKAMHPGIPTWFIARCHRFTLGLHWLRGVVFGDQRREPRHLALITASDSERSVDFTVRGPQPWTFLPLIRDGFEDTVLKRYPGLDFERIAPCPGKRKDGKPCNYEFNLKDLEALRWPDEHNVEKEYEIRCTRCRNKHHIESLLLGLSRAPARDAEKLDQILGAVYQEGEKTRAHFSKEIEEARQFIQLAFIQEWNTAQELEEQSCPTVFALYPLDGMTLTRKSTFQLQLYCMHPGCWHSIGSAGACQIHPLREGVVTAIRWVRTGLRWLKPAAALLPSGSQLAGEYSTALHEMAEHAGNELKLTAEVFKQIGEIPEVGAEGNADLIETPRARRQDQKVEIRELKSFLDKLDFPTKPYGGLRRVRTPEGHILWLCETHSAEFVRSL